MQRSFRSRMTEVVASPRRWLQIGAAAILMGAWIGGTLKFTPPNPSPVEPRRATLPATAPADAQVVATPSSVAAVEIPGSDSTSVTIAHNDTLERIFRRLALDIADLATIRALPDMRSRLDRLKPGEELVIRHRNAAVLGLDRRLSATEFLHVDRAAPTDDFSVNIESTPLQAVEHTARGTIRNSLIEAVVASGASEQTALALAEIFGWDIDFVLDIRPGDSFVMTYQELRRDGKYLSDGPILAARFVNDGREHVAVRYTAPDGLAHYYSPDGKSMRKAFLRAPVDFTRISSKFNLARHHPILDLIRAHKGVDYAAPTGTPVRAAGDGRVKFAGRQGGYGNVVELAHSNGISTVYGHLSRFAAGMSPGKRVSQGTVIAYVGMTGLATGPHLHYEYRVNGTARNPQTIRLDDATPINPSWKAEFLSATQPLIASLDDRIERSELARLGR
jgi:murein DD-endopeptidase MepM/ murein hydrolase activator NlpD